MIIDAHTHFTTAPLELPAYRGRQITDLGKPTRAKLQISDEQLERSMQGQFKRMQESGIDRLLFSPQASGYGPSLRFATHKPLLDRGLQRPHRPGRQTLAGQDFTRLPTAAVPGRRPQGMGRRAGTLRERAGVRELQCQSRRRRRPRTADAVPSNRVVVSAVGKNGGAGCAVHHSRQRVRSIRRCT